jgi:hypothetical protein
MHIVFQRLWYFDFYITEILGWGHLTTASMECQEVEDDNTEPENQPQKRSFWFAILLVGSAHGNGFWVFSPLGQLNHLHHIRCRVPHNKLKASSLQN